MTGWPSAARRFFNSAIPFARVDRGGQRRAAGVQAIFGGEDGKRAVADQLENVAAVLVDREEDRVGVVVEQGNGLFRLGVGDLREAAQIAEPDDGVDMLGDAAHDAPGEHALAGVAAEIGFHQRCGHARQRYRFDGEREVRRDALERRDLAVAESLGRPRRP